MFFIHRITVSESVFLHVFNIKQNGVMDSCAIYEIANQIYQGWESRLFGPLDHCFHYDKSDILLVF